MSKKLFYLLLWTAAYAIFITLFFWFLFDFQIWSTADWHRLARATIRGLKGLAFGASLISVIPVYLGSAKYVWKNKKLPFNFPRLSKKSEKESDATQIKNAELPATQPVFPENLPDELREPFIRIHSGILTKNAVDFLQSGTVEPPVSEIAPDAFMPLPDSFDAFEPEQSVPIFRDINFDNNSPVQISKKNGKKVATYIFDDPDFWVADSENDWFATGRQIKSPIKLLLEEQADKRVLVLKTKNIMDLEKLIPEWEKMGISIIQS
jgi:hypothetical protein